MIGNLLLWLGLFVLFVLAAWIVYTITATIRNDFTEWTNKVLNYRLDLNAKKTQIELNSVRVLRPNEHGYNGVVWNGETYLNLDSGELFRQEIHRAIDPLVEQWRIQNYEQRKLITAMAAMSGTEPVKMIDVPQIARLPDKIRLSDLVSGQTSLENLVVGVGIDEAGNQTEVRKSIHDLMHLLAIGITGTGKSTWVLAILAEIAMCAEPIDVVCVDVHGSAFNILKGWDKLRYPVARTNEEAKAVLLKVAQEADRRKALYETVPLAEDLKSYNVHSETPLHPWLVVIDEGTIMLADKTICNDVARVVQGTRQYGIYVFMTGQTAKANVIDTPIRDNFPTRIAFNNEDTSIKVALGTKPPEDLPDIAGRGWARLKGKKDPVMIQAPYIQRREFYELLKRSGPREEMPVIEGECIDVDLDRLVFDAYKELGDKANPTAICTKLHGYSGGNKFYDVRESMQRQGLTKE
jgi:DNA segregation ATPase FtsK/SpoIIIE-like protein